MIPRLYPVDRDETFIERYCLHPCTVALSFGYLSGLESDPLLASIEAL
jgi:hypothetical protein